MYYCNLCVESIMFECNNLFRKSILILLFYAFLLQYVDKVSESNNMV